MTAAGNDAAVGYYNALLGRGYRARELASGYVARFECSDLARAAAAEGWLGRLMGYVQAVAGFQAQLIEGVPNPGFGEAIYRWVPEPEAKQTDRHPRDLAIARIVAEAHQAAGIGDIRVTVPAEAIAHWRRLVERKQPKTNQQGG